MRAASFACLVQTLTIAYATAWTVPAEAHVRVAVEPTADLGAEELVVRAEGRETNIVFVRHDGSSYVVTSASSLDIGLGCSRRERARSVCVGLIRSVRVRGGDGDDVINLAGVPVPIVGDGGAGDDALTGGSADNLLQGGDGVDKLTGSSGSDTLVGGGGDDWLQGRAAADALFGDAGDDIIEAGPGDREFLVGGTGADLLNGGDGADSLQGGDGRDALFGGSGADTLAPGSGVDAVIDAGSADQLDCPTSIGNGEIRIGDCAQLTDGRPPRAWPPTSAGSEAATMSRRHKRRGWAKPMIPGKASIVVAKVPARVSRPVRRCVRTYSDRARRHPFPPYIAKLRTKFPAEIADPPPIPTSMAARLTRSSGCHRR